MKNILLCLDFRKGTDLLVEKATELALKLDSRIWLLHVADPNPDFAGYEAGPQFVRDEIARELRQEHSTLQALARQISNRRVQAEALLIQGQTVEAILDEAARLQADLLVIGHAQHSFFHRLLVGENTPRLIRKANIPILVVPLPDDAPSGN